MPAIEIIEVHELPHDVLRVRAHVEGIVDLFNVVHEETGQPLLDEATGEPEVREVPRVLEAFGWASAMTNHYPAEAYDEDGNLLLRDRAGHKLSKKTVDAEGTPVGDPVHEPRPMTSDERRSYCEQLIRQVLDAQPKPIEL